MTKDTIFYSYKPSGVRRCTHEFYNYSYSYFYHLNSVIASLLSSLNCYWCLRVQEQCAHTMQKTIAGVRHLKGQLSLTVCFIFFNPICTFCVKFTFCHSDTDISALVDLVQVTQSSDLSINPFIRLQDSYNYCLKCRYFFLYHKLFS